jgi:hypothetical protein
VTGEEVALVQSYFHARNARDLGALPTIVTQDLEWGPCHGIETLRSAWSEPYEHLDDVGIVDSTEFDGESVTACWRSELRLRHDASPAAAQARTSRFSFRDGLIARVELVDRGAWERA